MSRFEYVTSCTWGRPRDSSLWLDVPARMVELGLDVNDLARRQQFGRRAIAELRSFGVTGLIVAKVNGIEGAAAN